jgi:hypothetical protein
MEWQCWRHHLREHTREQVMVCAQGYYGILPLTEYAFLLGVRLKDKPPGTRPYHDILAHYGLSSQASTLCWNLSSRAAGEWVSTAAVIPRHRDFRSHVLAHQRCLVTMWLSLATPQ